MTNGFHGYRDARLHATNADIGSVYSYTYTFENFFHPFIGELIEQLNVGSVAGFLDPAFLKRLGEHRPQASMAQLWTHAAAETVSGSGTRARSRHRRSPASQPSRISSLIWLIRWKRLSSSTRLIPVDR